MTEPGVDYLKELSDWGVDDFDEHWEAVDRFIAEVGDAAAQQSALQWCRSPESNTQGAGLDVLGKLTRRHPELLPMLLGQVEQAVSSTDEDVRWSAAVAMQDLDDSRTQPFVLGLLNDEDSDVRYQAVNALPLPAQDNVPDDHPVVQALLTAMEDPDDVVRDWATMNLGLVRTSTLAVRDAFARHLEDPGEDTAGEAARALAMRGDARVRPVLLERLADPEVSYLFVWAAEDLADPTLLPLLLELQASGWPQDDSWTFVMTDAIKACSVAKET